MGEKDQVISALRATLISVKGALTLKQCNRDYRELQGEWIPFKKLGYPTLEKLFLDVPGFKVNQINGEWYVDAIASQETQHIATMVARQKSSKKSGPKLYPSRFPKRQDSWRKPSTTSSGSYKTNYNNQYSNQYYRVKGGTSNNYNNSYSTKFNKYSKSMPPPEVVPPPPRNTTQYDSRNSKQSSNRITTQHSDAVSKPSSTPSVKLMGTAIPAQLKQPTRTESDVKGSSGKVSASQRLTNLRDGFNTVDLIPLQLPSMINEFVESSGPVTNVAPACNLEPPPDFTSSVAKLEWTCQKLGLPEPIFKVYDHRPKRGPVSYDCSVKVGTKYNASSYPDSSPSDELAREVAALKLLSTIESSDAGGLSTSSDDKAIASLAELVSEHESGLWASTVPHLYREKYGENLPSNWQELVESCPRIIKERVFNGLLVLLLNKEEPKRQPQFETTYFDDTIIDSDLPPLQFPEDNFWNVFVTVANSTLEIWLRIIGTDYSDAFEALLSDMANHYEVHGTSVDRCMIINNAWYAVNVEDGGWQRAKILEIDTDTATVFLGDHGDDDVVSLSKIKILEPQFRKLPAQAILCRLEGIEELVASSQASELVRRRLQGEVLVAAPGSRDDPSDPSVAVVLYDTSTTRDLNLNKEIINDFCISGAFTVTQKACEVEVRCVTEEGRVWVSAAGGGALVRACLALLTAPGPCRRPLPPAAAAAAAAAPAGNHALYIVKTLDGDWVRCAIISGLDGEGTVRTLLVDSGLVLRAPLSSLVPLQAFSPALHAYPRQAIQVSLGDAERAAGSMTSRLRELLLGARVLCRALPSSSSSSSSSSSPTTANPSAPLVELFVRTEPQNMLASVNNSILMEYEYLHSDKPKQTARVDETTDHMEALSRKKERIFRSTSGGVSGEEVARGGGGHLAASSPPHAAAHSALPPPPIPAPGKCFDVYVTMAASPWNFIVQPNATRHMLKEMMASLQAECPKLSELDAPVNPASGELYTVFYEKDSTWYRIIIAGTVSTEMVSVYFCDYGDLELLTWKSLRPVPTSVPLARSLPPQAIKARLYDVYPLHHDWAVEDCIRFQQLCVEQQFVGMCKEVGRDPLNNNETLVTLDLIDTSTEEDIYLNKQLVAESRARLGTDSH